MKLRVVTDLLKVVKVSKAQSLQRSGRAGRESEGNCYRMLTRDEFERLSDETVPEIKRCNLTNVIMQVKFVSVSNIEGYPMWYKFYLFYFVVFLIL